MTVRFETPPDVRFTCSQCGDCCRGAWAIPLGPGERERIEGLDWRGKADALVGVHATASSVAPGWKGRRRLTRRPDGACTFLGDRNQCLIHEHFGAQAKPVACRTYPFGFRQVGERVAVDVAFSCRAVSTGSGALVAERTPEWAQLFQGDTAGEGPHLLARGRRISGELLWELEHGLLAVLLAEEVPLAERIRAAQVWIRLATTGDPTTPAAAQLREAVGRGLFKNLRTKPPPLGMDDTQRAVFYQWTFLALNPTPPDFHEWPRAEQETERRRRVAAGQRFRDRLGSPWIDGREIGPPFAEVAAVDAGAFPAAADAVLTTFFVAKVVGQRFLSSGEAEIPFVEAVPRLLVCHPMAAWTSKALAAARGAGSVEETDVRAAVRLLDRSLGQLSLEAFPRPQREACRFVFEETELAACAAAEILGQGSSGVASG